MTETPFQQADVGAGRRCQPHSTRRGPLAKRSRARRLRTARVRSSSAVANRRQARPTMIGKKSWREGRVANIRMKFVKAYVDGRGKPGHYSGPPGCRAMALPGLPGRDEFMAAYGQAVADTPRVEIAARQTRAGS